MLNIIQNTIGAIRRVGESVVRAGLKMWLPFTKAEPLGENIVINGDFATDSVWQKGNGWTIEDGKGVATSVPSGQSLSQSSSIISGVSYKVTYTVLDFSEGGVYVRVGNLGYGITRTANGTYTETIEALGNSTIYFTAYSGSTTLKIDNVSIEEYAQETPDISGNDNNAILKTGKALVFAGNDSVETSFPSSKTIKTIAFWIYPTHSASQEVLFNLGMTNIPVPNMGNRVIELNHLTIRNRINYPLNFDVYIDGVYRGETNWNGDNPTLEENQWQRVVFVNSNGTSTVNDTFDIAYTGSGSHGRFKMSDLQIYGADWTTDDIAYDYANPQKLVTDNASSNVTLNDLHAWWHMSEGDGTIAFDSAPLIGDELVANGDFATNSDWSFGTNTTITEGKLVCSSSSAYNSTTQSISMKAGTYIVTYTIDSISGGVIFFGFDGVNGANRNTSGTYTEYIVVPSNSSNLFIAPTTNGIQFEISNVSAKEVYNIDGETYDGSSLGATYDDAQERIPQLGMMNWSKGSNLIDYSDSTFWSAINGAVRSFDSDIVNPDSTVGCWKVTFDGTINGRIQRPVVATGLLTYSVWLKVDSGTQPAQIGGSTSGALAITVTDEWQRFTHTQTYTSSTTYPRLRCDVDGAEIYIWLAQLEDADSASAYRRTNGTAVTDATLISCATDSQKDILDNAVRVKGSGFNLDGTGYAEVLDDNVFDVGVNEAFSICGWARWDYVLQDSSTLNVIFSNGLTVGTANNFSISSRQYSDGNKVVSVFINGAQINSTTNYTNGEWFYFAFTRQAGGGNNTCTLYTSKIDQNGNWVVTSEGTTGNNAGVSNSYPKLIGWDGLVNDRKYHNLIDDIKFYDRELSSNEIEQNFNATKSGHNN